MKRIALAGFTLVFIAVAASSCKKDRIEADDLAAMCSNQADDDARLSDEFDALSMDATRVVEAAPILAGARVDWQDLCDATVSYDTLGTNRTVTIAYNGTNCIGNRTRVGNVVITMPLGVQWSSPGATMTVDIQNLVITRLSDGKTITLNGMKTVTNVTGGLVHNLSSAGSITHTVYGNDLSITFDNGSEWHWNVARQRVFTYDDGVVVTVTGLQSNGGVTGIAEWGINRHGDAFETAIVEPLVIREDCDFRITAGKKLHHVGQRYVTVTLGLDANGNPTSCPGFGNPYYLKAEWNDPQGNYHFVMKPY